MTPYRITSVVLALALIAGVGGATVMLNAQAAEPSTQGPQGMVPGMDHRMGPGMMGPGMMGAGMHPAMAERYVEGRIAFLHTELKITPAQARLWDGYADALRASAKDMAGMHATMTAMMSAKALPERLDTAEKMMTERLDALKKIKAATLPLYAEFSAEQKATADELMPVMGMGMGMSWGMGR